MTSEEESQVNQSILDRVEALGGGYVRDAEVFAVNLMGVALDDDEARPLCGLLSIQQIALDASQLSYGTINALPRIGGLQSLVLGRRALSDSQRSELGRLGPSVIEVDA